MYNLAALAVWPAGKTLEVVMASGPHAIIPYVEDEISLHGGSLSADARELLRKLADGLVDLARKRFGLGLLDIDVVRATRLIPMLGDREVTANYLDEVLGSRYRGGDEENNALVAALATLEQSAAAAVYCALLRKHELYYLLKLLKVAVSLCVAFESSGAAGWRKALYTVVEGLIAGFDRVGRKLAGERRMNFLIQEDRVVLKPESIRDVFVLIAKLDDEGMAGRFAQLLLRDAELMRSDRTIPEALSLLCHLPGQEAYTTLWNHLAGRALARSATPPEYPQDWTIPFNGPCPCNLCQILRRFCADPQLTEQEFKVKKNLRAHIRSEILAESVSIECETIRAGLPYTLICRKVDKAYAERLATYFEDIEVMRLLRVAAGASEDGLRRLETALANAG